MCVCVLRIEYAVMAQGQQVIAQSKDYNPGATTCIVMIVGIHREVPQSFWCNDGVLTLERGRGGNAQTLVGR